MKSIIFIVLRITFWPALWGLSLIYRSAVWIHRKFTVSRKIRLPVISVGNITTGGTGKTPAVLNILEILLSENVKSAVLTRGYGGRAKGIRRVSEEDNVNTVGDEAVLIKKKRPNTEIIVGANRFRSAEVAVEDAVVEIILLDDGLQSWELERDLNIVMIDCLAPFGGGRLLPLGSLREPLAGLSRAHVAVLNRSDMITDEELRNIELCIKKYNARMKIFHSREKIRSFKEISGRKELTPADFSNKKVLCFSGIGNPKGFYFLLKEANVNIIKKIEKKDHHLWTVNELKNIVEVAKRGNLEIVTTEKDAVRLPQNVIGEGWMLEMELKILEESEWKIFINEIRN